MNRRQILTSIPAALIPATIGQATPSTTWEDRQIASLMAEYIRRRGKAGLVEELAEALLADYQGDDAISMAEYGRIEPRLEAIGREALRRRRAN